MEGEVTEHDQEWAMILDDIEILCTLARIESQLTNDVGLDLLEHIRCLENYQRALTFEDLRFLHELRIAG